MKTHAIAQLIRRVDEGASSTSDDLDAFAAVLLEDADQTAAAFVKSRATPDEYPARLKDRIDFLVDVFAIAGAKQAEASVRALAPLFEGAPSQSADKFLQIVRTKAAPKQKAAAKPAPEPDHDLARALADRLMDAASDKSLRDSVFNDLRNAKQVNTPTLHAVANITFCEKKVYRGRKTVIERLEAWIKAEDRIRNFGSALNRVGV